MYESYWQLRQKPFENCADPRFYYPGQPHQAGGKKSSSERRVVTCGLHIQRIRRQ